MRHFRVDAPLRLVSIDISPTARVIAAVSTVVILSGWLREIYVFTYGPTAALGFLTLFDVERSLTNWLQPILLATAGLLLACIATLSKNDSDPIWSRWAALGVLFVFLSLNETTNLDALGIVTSEILGFGNPLIMLSPLVVVAGTFCVYFCRILTVVPTRYAYAFVLSGALLVGGAVGLEIISQSMMKGSGAYVVAASLEETFETAGAAVFCIALLGYLRDRLKKSTLMFR